MSKALQEAIKAFNEEEVPVGAVIVYQKKILATGYNKVEQFQDSTQHAECIAIRAAAKALGNWRLNGALLYTTLEPCAMCSGAILQSRVSEVIWGARDVRLGANGSWVDLFSIKHPFHAVKTVGGVMEKESANLLRRFFNNKRKGVISYE